MGPQERRHASILAVIFISLRFLGCSASGTCDPFTRPFNPECRNLSNSTPKKTVRETRAAPTGGACTGTSLKYTISCPVSSGGPGGTPVDGSDGTATNCYSGATTSGYVVLVLADNSGGFFTSPTTGNVANNCDDALSQLLNTDPTLPSLVASDVAGIVSVGAGAGGVSCTDVAGCVQTGTPCLATWDDVNKIPTSAEATFGGASNYLLCSFIDVAPGNGSLIPNYTPFAYTTGVFSGFPHAFISISVGGGSTTNITDWGDY